MIKDVFRALRLAERPVLIYGAGVRLADATVDDGIRSVASLLGSDRLRIHRSANGLVGEIPGYVWKSGRLGLTEQPIEINDDACDALRYAVMAFEPDGDNPWASLSSAGGMA